MDFALTSVHIKISSINCFVGSIFHFNVSEKGKITSCTRNKFDINLLVTRSHKSLRRTIANFSHISVHPKSLNLLEGISSISPEWKVVCRGTVESTKKVHKLKSWFLEKYAESFPYTPLCFLKFNTFSVVFGGCV